MEFDVFRQSLENFEEGDLVATMALIEGIDELINHPDTVELTDLLLDVRVALENLIRTGDDPNYRDLLQSLAEHLATGFESSPAAENPAAENPAETPDVQSPAPGIRIEDAEVLYSFFDEAHEHLDSIEEKILTLEQSKDTELINDIFRSMHTIKGVSSFMGLTHVKELSHQLESLLDDMREGTLEADTEIVDLLLGGTDLLTRIIEDLEQQTSQRPKGAITVREIDVDSAGLIERVQRRRTRVVEQDRPESFAEEIATPEMLEKFVAETGELIDHVEQGLLTLEANPNDLTPVGESFRAIHTVKGNAGFFWFRGIEQRCMRIESLLDALRSESDAASPKVVTLLLGDVDAIRKDLNRIQAGELNPGDDDGPVPVDGDELPALGEVLVKSGAVQAEDIERALELQRMKLGEILVAEGVTTKETVDEALAQQGKSPEEAREGRTQVARQHIRVDTDRLDRLFDLIGELITAEAMLLGNPALTGLDIEGFDRGASNLSKITREMQEVTMSIRMIPLDGLFNKMRRLVRDLARKFEKPINLRISGEDTEMDRTVIEEVSDPLVHIIRNAIDHGIEDARERKRSGKNAVGAVHLSAKYEGNEVWISVRDDGKGLSREKILATAKKRGMAVQDGMDDQEVWRLIFEPGFSTAAKVSEISGRGVGMDVVRRNIEKLRGKIDVQSEEGAGTEIIMRIPLTLAIIDAVTVRVGKTDYCVPIMDVLEFHKCLESQITYTEDQRPVLSLREDVLPVLLLHDYFGVKKNGMKPEDGVMVIVHSNHRRAALVVDQIMGYRQVVIKALPEYMGNMRGISGCTIMGNGDISLIIDTGALLSGVGARWKD